MPFLSLAIFHGTTTMTNGVIHNTMEIIPTDTEMTNNEQRKVMETLRVPVCGKLEVKIVFGSKGLTVEAYLPSSLVH